jgi:hypothetical protein
VARHADGKATRPYDVARMHLEGSPPVAPHDAGAWAGCRRVASASGGYLVRGFRLLGQHYTAFVWTTESGHASLDERSDSA